jgi:hypothetical protein
MRIEVCVVFVAVEFSVDTNWVKPKNGDDDYTAYEVVELGTRLRGGFGSSVGGSVGSSVVCSRPQIYLGLDADRAVGGSVIGQWGRPASQSACRVL